jgi:hypothetical protein
MKRYFITIIHVFLNFTEDQIVIKIILLLFLSPLSIIVYYLCRVSKAMAMSQIVTYVTSYILFRPRHGHGHRTPKVKFPRNFLVNRNDLWRISELSKLKTTFSFQDSCQTIWGFQHKIYYKWNCISFIIIWLFNLLISKLWLEQCSLAVSFFYSNSAFLPWRLFKVINYLKVLSSEMDPAEIRLIR